MTTPLPRGRLDHLEQDIVAALQDGVVDDAGYRELLQRLWERTGDLVARLESVTDLSEAAAGIQRPSRNLLARYARQINILERMIRISDRNQSDLKRLNQALVEASTHDQLTGLTNRRFMTDRCRQEDRRIERHGGSYALLLLDADHFKRINDNHGHDIGDLALIQLGQAFRSSLRQEDLCARWGGEEFLALLIEASLDAAMVVAARTLEASRAIAIQLGGIQVRVTASIGIAAHVSGETYADTLKRADDALYEAKHEGRDRYVIARG
jgi:diguanylate cyclase (GGDEF)-like protein